MSVPGFMPQLVGGSAGVVLAAAYLTTDYSASILTVFTFSSKTFGAAAATRRIVCAVGYRNKLGNALTSATIGGVTATIHADINDDRSIALISALVPSGTTGDVVLTFNNTMETCSIGLFRQVGETDPVPVLASDIIESGNVFSTGVTMSDAGILYGVAAIRFGSSITWSGDLSGTGDFSAVGAKFQYSGVVAAVASGSRTGTATTDIAPGTGGIIVAGWI